MIRLLRWLLGFAVGFGLTLAAVNVSRQGAEPGAGERLGRLNLVRYCAVELGAGATAVLRPSTEVQWACRDANGVLQSDAIDTAHACEVLYGPPAYSVTARADVGVVAWDCYRGPAP